MQFLSKRVQLHITANKLSTISSGKNQIEDIVSWVFLSHTLKKDFKPQIICIDIIVY